MFAVSARRTMAGARPKAVPTPSAVAVPPPAPLIEPKAWPVLRSPVQILIAEIADEHGVTVAEVMSHSRTVKLVAARRAAMVAVYEHLAKRQGEFGLLTTLGRIFHRDHTTVYHALKKAGVR